MLRFFSATQRRYSNVAKPKGFWNDEENVNEFLKDFKVKFKLETEEDWNKVSQKQIQENGGRSLFTKYTLYDLKNLAYPGIKKITRKEIGYWDNDENIQKFVNQLKEQCNLKTLDDWNKLTSKQVIDYGGKYLLSKISMYKLKCIGCNEIEKKFPKIHQKPFSFWKNEENLLNFLNNIKEEDKRNGLSVKIIENYGGRSLLKKYSIYELNSKLLDSNIEIKRKKPKGYWDNQENINKFIFYLKNQLKLETKEDWNNLKVKQIQELGGRSLLLKYSLLEIKKFGFPKLNEENEEIKERKSSGYWENKKNLQLFLDKLKNTYNLKTYKDWNKITKKQIKELGGGHLFSFYSLYQLKSMGNIDFNKKYNQDQQNNDKKPSKPKGFWKNEENLQFFLKLLEEKYELRTPDDWNYKINQKVIKENGGASLLSTYSLFELKCKGCSDFEHFYSTFKKSEEYWDDKKNIESFFSQIKEKMNLRTQEDWNRLSKIQIKSHGGLGLALKHSLKQIIQLQNPDAKISSNNNKRSSQRWLFLQIQKLFPNDEIVEDYFHSDIYRDTGFAIQFDIFLIQRNIAIEYHGKQHYEEISAVFSPFEMYKHRDQEKQRLCKEYGIHLIIIPYWWNNRLDSLKATISSVL